MNGLDKDRQYNHMYFDEKTNSIFVLYNDNNMLLVYLIIKNQDIQRQILLKGFSFMVKTRSEKKQDMRIALSCRRQNV